MSQTRRRFLILSARALAAAPLVACGDDESPAPTDAGNQDTGIADAGADVVADTATDTQTDMGVDITEDVAPLPLTADVITATKGPWAMITGLTSMRIRLEARADVTLTATLIPPTGDPVSGATERNTDDIEMEWPLEVFLEQTDYPDEKGPHTLYDIHFTDLEPGVRYTYELSVDDAEPIRGEFRAPPASGEAFRAIWVADTMFPKSEETGRMCGEAEADLFLHGGDIQYFSNPIDTWNGYFAFFKQALAHSAGHHAIGNHEYENFDEYDSHFVRLFGGQGEPTGTEEYFAFWFGGWRFVFMNSEVEFGSPDTAQSQWMEAELAASAATEGHLGTIVAFHRPVFTFGKSSPKVEARNYIHPFFKEHGVKLVLMGHNHGYERFEYDGIYYVVDGGGGAGITDINKTLDEVIAERPEEEAMRKVASPSYGTLLMEFSAEGEISMTRTKIDGELADEFKIV